jgi:P4 family phage/plasmid primase-like protien
MATEQIFKTANDGADFWRYVIGVNVIPADTRSKMQDDTKLRISWKQWQDKPIPEELHEQWKNNGDFERLGLAVICGKVWHNKTKSDLYLCAIDCDNAKAIEELSKEGLAKIARNTLTEQHKDNPDKCHVYFYTAKPITKKSSDKTDKELAEKIDANQIPAFEVKGAGEHGIMFVSPSTHKSGQKYEIIDSYTPMVFEHAEKVIDDICQKYNIPYLSIAKNGKALLPMSEMVKDDFVIYAGHDRHTAVMRYMASKRIRNPEFSDDIILALAKEYNQKHCNPPLDDSDPVWTREFNSAKKFSGKIIQENKEQEKDEQTQEKVSKSKAIIDETANLIKAKYSFVTIGETNEILLYDGKIYNKAKAEALIIAEAEKIIESATTHDRNEVLNKIKASTYPPKDSELDMRPDHAKFDSDPNLVTVNNGILDLENLELRPHTPEHLSRVLLPVEYQRPQYEIKDESIFADIEKNLENTLFYQFLKRSFTVNGEFRKDDFETVLEIIASPMIKRQIDEKAFMFLGGGKNGKSSALEYIFNLYGGKANVSRIPLQALAEDKFMAAELVGKSANIFEDLEPSEMKHTGKIKTIISGEGMQAQEKYQKPFVLIPFAKMMFSCNRFPKIYDQSQGFFRRWMIVKWERNFEKDPENDPHLKQKLANNQDELNLVFSCLAYLARRLNKNGQFTHSKDWKKTQREWNENADPLDDFVSNYIKSSEKNTSVHETHRFYKGVMQAKGENPLGIGQFGKAFAEYFEQLTIWDKDRKTAAKCWCNIELDLDAFQKLTGFAFV